MELVKIDDETLEEVYRKKISKQDILEELEGLNSRVAELNELLKRFD